MSMPDRRSFILILTRLLRRFGSSIGVSARRPEERNLESARMGEGRPTDGRARVEGRRAARSDAAAAGARNGHPDGRPRARRRPRPLPPPKREHPAAARPPHRRVRRRGKGPRPKSSSKKKSAKGRRKATRQSATKREISAGGVVYRRSDDEIEIVLASRRTRRGELAWGLAKGGIEDDESMEDAAIREVREETGLTRRDRDRRSERPDTSTSGRTCASARPCTSS